MDGRATWGLHDAEVGEHFGEHREDEALAVRTRAGRAAG